MNSQARLQFTVGRFLCATVRDYLENEAFCGRPIYWREGRGWFERRITVMGPTEHLKEIQKDLEKFGNSLIQ